MTEVEEEEFKRESSYKQQRPGWIGSKCLGPSSLNPEKFLLIPVERAFQLFNKRQTIIPPWTTHWALIERSTGIKPSQQIIGECQKINAELGRLDTLIPTNTFTNLHYHR